MPQLVPPTSRRCGRLAQVSSWTSTSSARRIMGASGCRDRPASIGSSDVRTNVRAADRGSRFKAEVCDSSGTLLMLIGFCNGKREQRSADALPPDADASATGYIGTRYPAMRLGGTASHNCRIMHSCPKIKQNHTCIICRQSSRPTAASTSSPAPELAPRAAARGATVSPYRHGQAWGLKANPVCRSLFWSEGEVDR